MRVGLIMGSFDPITIGHVRIASILINYNIVDKVIFVVAKQNPWKTVKSTNFELRVNMCEVATRPLGSRCIVSAIESTIDGESYSCKVLDKIRAENENNELFLVCGTDVMATVDKWKNFSSNIFPHFNFIEINRYSDSFTMDAEQLCVISRKTRIFDKCGTKETILIVPRAIDISSTLVRHLVKDGKDPYPYVTEQVAEIIKFNNLYK